MRLSYCGILSAILPLLCLLSGTARGDASQRYCSFFNNRAPMPQPSLNNCTWYRDNCCCMPQELKITFARLKPMPGASPKCIRFMNYLMCYICSPDQFKFYGREYLTVCLEFCELWFEACQDSMIEGSVIGHLYRSGRDFCEDRNFKVDADRHRSPNVRNCFFFTGHGEAIPTGVATPMLSSKIAFAIAVAAMLLNLRIQ